MTALVAYWPQSGRWEVFAAFPGSPGLAERGESDAVGGLYVRMKERGELWQFPGLVTDVVAFIDRCVSELAGADIQGVAADRYRKEECRQALSLAGVLWPVVWRGQGASATADGSTDVRAFQSEVLNGNIQCTRNLVMDSAIANSEVSRDAAGNPKLDKSKSKGRIDALQAGVMAAGMGKRWRAKPPLQARYRGLA